MVDEDKQKILSDLFGGDGKSDLKDMVSELNSDEVGKDGFSKIDTRTRLSANQINAIMSIDTLIKLNVYPSELENFTMSAKLLMISHKGKGRAEIVDIMKADREAKRGETLAQKVMG